MNPYKIVREKVLAALIGLVEAGRLDGGLSWERISVEPPRDAAHGDMATNAAMVLAKPASMKPRDLAELIVERLAGDEHIAGTEIAGPGFINLILEDGFWHGVLGEILEAGTGYGASDLGDGRPINIEYVSANPTGPMHVGHCRGAVVGDALARLLAKAGFAVSKEYYINDAGAQVDQLARSLYVRYREALGEDVGTFPDDLYPGDYLIPVAAELAERDSDKWLGEEPHWLAPLRDLAIDKMMAMIRDDLAALGVSHDIFTSERALVAASKVDAALGDLEARGLIYTGQLEPPKGKQLDDWEPRPQLLFQATRFGDDVDRPVRKSDGGWTYFATDMAYHRDKFERGFANMINIWGADHGGYVKRLKAAVEALTEGDGSLDVRLCQMVNLLEDGLPAKMSKRAGTFVSLRDVLDAVGKDVVRFIMLTRKNDAQLDFDLVKVQEQSRENPVFYVQYSHARCHSVLRHAADLFGADKVSDSALMTAGLNQLTDPGELALIKKMAEWPRVVDGAAAAFEPHRIAYYLIELAGEFHTLWTKGAREDTNLRFLQENEYGLSLARLGLVKALATIIASGLDVMGVTPVEEM